MSKESSATRLYRSVPFLFNGYLVRVITGEPQPSKTQLDVVERQDKFEIDGKILEGHVNVTILQAKKDEVVMRSMTHYKSGVTAGCDWAWLAWHNGIDLDQHKGSKPHGEAPPRRQAKVSTAPQS